MTTLARFAQLEYGTTCHHLTTVGKEILHHLFEVEQTRLTVNQGNQVHTKGILKLGVLVEIIENDLRHFTALQFYHQTHTVFVRLVANIGDAFDFLFVDKLGDALLQGLFIDLIRQRIHHNRLTIVPNVFEVRLGAHDHTAAAGAIAFAHTDDAVNDTACWKVWRRD